MKGGVREQGKGKKANGGERKGKMVKAKWARSEKRERAKKI